MSQQDKDELKKKGLQPGDQDEDDEEEDLGAGPGVSATPSITKGGAKGGPKKEDKKIEISESMLREIIESNKDLKRTVDQLSSNAVAQSPGLQVRRKTRDFDYTLRKWEDKVVLGFANKGTEKRPLYVYSIYNKETRLQEQFVDLILKGEKNNVEKIDYITFLRDAEKIKARMISKVEHEDIKEYGMIPKKEMAENGYGMYETMVMIPVEVVTKTYTMTLKLSDEDGGDEVVVDSQWLNL